jgi:hypothetical protein
MQGASMSISYNFLGNSAVQHAAKLPDASGKDSAENEYARINRLLTDMAREMSGSMEEIQKINSMMRMISFNSKIEAAKAGDAGKAFAVVSGEMKSLSEQTATVAKRLGQDTNQAINQLRNISNDLATHVRGTRLSDLALTNIDLIDRNLYERSCDVRWWATDSSLVEALSVNSDAACAYASKRLGVILNAYTVYFDLVLCDIQGDIVANGRPNLYCSHGKNQGTQPWFLKAMNSRSGDDYGFQTVHESGLVGGERVLVYSASVREGGKSTGKILGALGILFNYDALAQTIMHNTPVDKDLLAITRVCIIDGQGLLLADSRERLLQETLDFAGMKVLLQQEKGFIIGEVNGRRSCIAHARAPGYETYSTGWHSLILQEI